MGDLNGLMNDNNFILISSVIRKDKLIKRDANPYEVAMKFCLERLYFFS
ncbi:hypothetical protein J524_0838 [Acinetobacter baumannii 496487]|uniref:Uncharacterized protein n=2 Tax=Acinetobacter baumannii TaxID=470 RepID=A0A836LZG4_ACIBA|nr:hypothetical protein J712_2395 [Acinetobacter baumannii 722310]EXI01459.1 hypothetical protein J618_1465 [Acinetobacter baumannii 607805]EXI04913.1 hypothetical protein J639_1605 [Acinetobacter baumannii 457946]EXQ92605.1 hypothetical protein J681_1524 [Acinetobacter baumannii 1170863]EXR13345.1 hypothetical protein J675_1431 [Acinetobacter baumannii 1413735]EXR73816.1 hypothetical protein J697_0964 [Acinetobacter baumannii 14216]EXR85399.1 hypothetical protein J682_2141 [Acinetobacter bau